MDKKNKAKKINGKDLRDNVNQLLDDDFDSVVIIANKEVPSKENGVETNTQVFSNISRPEEFLGVQNATFLYINALQEYKALHGSSFDIDNLIEDTLNSIKKSDPKLAKEIARKVSVGLAKFVDKL